jgi:hypothetical protein
MTSSAAADDEFDKRLRRGAALKLTLDRQTLTDPAISERSKYVIVVSALLPDQDIWFVICTSKTAHFDDNPRLSGDVLRWSPASVDRAKPAICRHFKTGHFR